MKRIVAAIEVATSLSTRKIKTNIDIFGYTYMVTTSICLPTKESDKMQECEELRNRIDMIVNSYKADSKEALMNNSTVLYWASSYSQANCVKISLVATFYMKDVKRRMANVSIQQKYARRIIKQIKASMDAQFYTK